MLELVILGLKVSAKGALKEGGYGYKRAMWEILMITLLSILIVIGGHKKLYKLCTTKYTQKYNSESVGYINISITILYYI